MKDKVNNRRYFLRNGVSGLAILGASTLPIWASTGDLQPDSKKLWQPLDIYKEGDQYKVRGRINNKIYKSSPISNEAIQYAIDSFGNHGGEIVLFSGIYILEKQINLASRINLKGSGTATNLYLSPSHNTGAAFYGQQLDRIVIADLSIKAQKSDAHAKNGIILDHCGDSVIRDVYAVGMAEHGIWIRNNSFLCEVRGCKFADIAGSAVLMEKLAKGGRAGEYIPNLITNCIAYGGGKGFECKRSIVLNIVACQVYQSKGVAFYVGSSSNSVLISGCRTFQIQDHAVVVEKSDEINITSNTFCWHIGHGILIKNINWGTITGNCIIDSGSVNPYSNEHKNMYVPVNIDIKPHLRNGIHIAGLSKGLTITGNAIFNWIVAPPMQYGIREEKECMNNLIVANNINYFDKAGILSEGLNTEVHNNNSTKENNREPEKTTEKLQVFDVRLIDKFIENQRG